MLDVRALSTSGGHVSINPYGYLPSLAAGIIFLVLFGTLTAVHLGVLLKSRRWWTIVTVVGGLCEILGWVGRTWSHFNVHLVAPFQLQLVLLILAPSFFSATLYATTGLLIKQVGAQYSLLRPSRYLLTFCALDVFAILVQAAGGAMAALAIPKGKSPKKGTHVMVGGIIIQMIGMIIFSALGASFFLKARRDAASALRRHAAGSRLALLMSALAWCSFWILIRCIYRTVELSDGWFGYVITHEPFFLCLDAVPMVLTLAGLVVAHPHFGLRGASAEGEKQTELVPIQP